MVHTRCGSHQRLFTRSCVNQMSLFGKWSIYQDSISFWNSYDTDIMSQSSNLVVLSAQKTWDARYGPKNSWDRKSCLFASEYISNRSIKKLICFSFCKNLCCVAVRKFFTSRLFFHLSEFFSVTIQTQRYAVSKYSRDWECSGDLDIWARMSNRAQSAQRHEHHESRCSECSESWAT